MDFLKQTWLFVHGTHPPYNPQWSTAFIIQVRKLTNGAFWGPLVVMFMTLYFTMIFPYLDFLFFYFIVSGIFSGFLISFAYQCHIFWTSYLLVFLDLSFSGLLISFTSHIMIFRDFPSPAACSDSQRPGRVERPRWPRCGAMRRRFTFFWVKQREIPATRRFQMQGIYGDLMMILWDLMIWNLWWFDGNIMVISWEYDGDISWYDMGINGDGMGRKKCSGFLKWGCS